MRKMLAMGLACMIALAPAASVDAAELPPATCHIGGCNLGDCFRDLDCDGVCGNHYFVDAVAAQQASHRSIFFLFLVKRK